jgi:vesicle coat complex subunit
MAVTVKIYSLRRPRKEAIQKTIMSMTLGKDVSALFPDVLKNIATPDLDQKKLVYLYLMYVSISSAG